MTASIAYRGYLETVRAEGWDAAVRRMIADAPAGARGAMLRTLLDDSRAGWLFLLDKQRDAVALDFGCGLGAVSAALARHCAHVVACDVSLERVQLVRERARSQQLSNLSFVCAGDSLRLPFPDAYFDLVILNGVFDQVFDHHHGDPTTMRLAFLREVNRTLKPAGQLYLASERSPADSREAQRRTAIPRQRRLLVRAGFASTHQYSLLPSFRHIDQIVDLADTSQMQPVLPLYRGQSRIRQTLLRGRLHKYVAPSVGIVASKRSRDARFVDRLVRHVYAALTPATPNSRCAVRHYRLSQKGMLILEANGPSGDLIIRVPLNPIARHHAQRNASATAAVHTDAAIPTELRACVPRPLGAGEYDGTPYFAETRIHGCEASALESPALRARALRAGVDFAVALHQSGGATTFLDAASYDTLVEGQITAMSQLVRGEAYDNVVARIRDYLWTHLLRERLPLLRQMGDFALSNLIVAPADAHLDGVIDWDRSRAHGLPLLDVAHLFASSSWASMCAGDVLTRMLLPQQFDAQQHQNWESYRERMALPAASVRPLCVVWWLDFIGGRLDTSAPLDEAWVTRNVRNVLDYARENLR